MNRLLLGIGMLMVLEGVGVCVIAVIDPNDPASLALRLTGVAYGSLVAALGGFLLGAFSHE